MKNYFPLLDAVRFFAAFWVMNFHYLLGVSGELHWYRYGNLGVQLFFIISGFVIVQSLQGKNLLDFAKGRFIRLFPLFWIICTITFIVPYLVPHTSTSTFSQYIISMTMLGDIFNGFFGSSGLVDPSYWTLTVELLFYIEIAVFCSLFSYKNIRYFLGSWLLFSVLAFMLRVDQNFYIKLFLVRHTAYFVFGGALALIATKQAKKMYEKYIDVALVFLSALFALYIHPRALLAYTTPYYLDTFIVTALHIIIFLAVPLLVYLSGYLKNVHIVRGLALLGGITYPLYLLHQKIGNTLINFVTNTYHISWYNFAVCFEVIMIMIAYFVYTQDAKLRKYLGLKFKIK